MAFYFDQWHFNDDAPLSLSTTEGIADKDTFHRRHLAKRLATLLAKKQASEADSRNVSSSSFTVAICGPWGTGKTSLRNLTEKELTENASCPHIAHFNPRQWSNEAAIINAFFEQLSSAVERDKAKEKKKIATTLRNIGNVLSYAQKATEVIAVVTALSPLAPAAPALIAAGEGMGKVAAVAKDAEERIEGKKAASLTELQDQARSLMLKLKKPIVVFIDDLDRLTGPEVALVFQLLKFNADFPNVVYVLLADRVVLENGLDALYPNAGARYLEKFVQLFIDLPKLTTDALQSEFRKEFEPLAKAIHAQSSGEELPSISNDVFSAYSEMFAPYLSTMRRIRLYFNAVHFSLPLGRNSEDDQWEVFPFDVMLLELLLF